MSVPLRIGLSSRLMYPDPARTVLPGKVVHYADENASNWLMAGGAVVFVIPRLGDATAAVPGAVEVTSYVDALDGLVLQGGADVAPSTYGEEPLDAEWAGDAPRDRYELALMQEFQRQRKPVLGICRGCQLINVALGGTLYQDLATQRAGSIRHRDERRYDANVHDVSILPGTRLAEIHGGARRVRVNSIHHQAIKRLAHDLVVEAVSDPDGVIEAVRLTGPQYVVGVQWHPEFIAPGHAELLSPEPLRADFFSACERSRLESAASSRTWVNQS